MPQWETSCMLYFITVRYCIGLYFTWGCMFYSDVLCVLRSNVTQETFYVCKHLQYSASIRIMLFEFSQCRVIIFLHMAFSSENSHIVNLIWSHVEFICQDEFVNILWDFSRFNNRNLFAILQIFSCPIIYFCESNSCPSKLSELNSQLCLDWTDSWGPLFAPARDSNAYPDIQPCPDASSPFSAVSSSRFSLCQARLHWRSLENVEDRRQDVLYLLQSTFCDRVSDISLSAAENV